MKTARTLILTAALAGLLSTAAPAALYVSPDGDDANPGTISPKQIGRKWNCLPAISRRG